MIKTVKGLAGQLIVSCQAEAGFPLNSPDHLAALAETAVIGGAAGIRASGPENILRMRRSIAQPIIGIYKKTYPGFEVYITPTFEDAEEVISAGADIIALDATNRDRPGTLALRELIQKLKSTYGLPIMADIATLEEGQQAAAFGADIVGTTLSGYTTASKGQPMPNLNLVAELASLLEVPVIAEGGIGTPEEARAALDAGAYAVVVGSMITRPHLITQRFFNAIQAPRMLGSVLAVDIGGTKISLGMVDTQGKVLNKTVIPSERQAGGGAILQQVIHLVEKQLETHRAFSPEAIGVATGGQVDRSGQIVGGTDMIPDWVGTPLKEALATRFRLLTTVINDGHAAAIAEAVHGAGQGKPSMLCIVIGTGLGGGLVIDQEIQFGTHGLAGSLGQLNVLTGEGEYLPLEALVSGPGLLAIYQSYDGVNKNITSAEQIADLARAGDPLAQQAVQAMGRWLGLGLSQALSIFDTSCVVVGGSVAKTGEMLFESARQGLRKHGYSSTARTPILPAQLGTEAQLVGAAVYARQCFGAVLH